MLDVSKARAPAYLGCIGFEFAAKPPHCLKNSFRCGSATSYILHPTSYILHLPCVEGVEAEHEARGEERAADEKNAAVGGGICQEAPASGQHTTGS